MRLLAPVALQSRSGRGRQEPVQPRLEGAQLGKLPRLPARRGSLPLRQEGLPQRGRGTLRRGPEDGPAPLQDLRPQAGRGLEPGVISMNSSRGFPNPLLPNTSSGAPNRMRRFDIVYLLYYISPNLSDLELLGFTSTYSSM